jgi:AraC family transcriptional regulator
MSVLLALTTDLDAGSPAGRLYGESLANALAVYLLSRYAVQRRVPTVPKEVFPISVAARARLYRRQSGGRHQLADLAELAGMSAHHFAELFKRSMELHTTPLCAEGENRTGRECVA